MSSDIKTLKDNKCAGVHDVFGIHYNFFIVSKKQQQHFLNGVFWSYYDLFQVNWLVQN